MLKNTTGSITVSDFLSASEIKVSNQGFRTSDFIVLTLKALKLTCFNADGPYKTDACC